MNIIQPSSVDIRPLKPTWPLVKCSVAKLYKPGNLLQAFHNKPSRSKKN